MPPPASSRLLMSGNEAVARAVWESGVRVASAYPGTPATEILESLTRYPDVDAQWAVNEKVSLEVTIGASMAGARAFCAMKHVGMNVAADALMSVTLAGAEGGLVIVIADDVGLSSSQNEQDSRFWCRFAHLPMLEPADSQESYAMTLEAFEMSERFGIPVIVRMTTRVCHVKSLVTVGERRERTGKAFAHDPSHWVMVPANAQRRLNMQPARDAELAKYSNASPLNILEPGKDKRIGFITSGPAYLHVKEAFPDSPVLKMGLSYPLPLDKVREMAGQVDRLVVVEETELLVENDLKAAGIQVEGKNLLPKSGELIPAVLVPAIKKSLGDPVPARIVDPPVPVFPRPPTLCGGCPHLGVYYTLSRLRRQVSISGDIGCYTLGALHPWKALDATICMGASMGIALGLDKGRSAEDKDKAVIGVIGDSTFLHMGMQGLLNIVYNRGNVTVIILDNRTVGMTGGQDHPGTGRDAYGAETARVDFVKLVEALGVKPNRIRKVDPYQLPVLYKAIKDEMAIPEVSVIITDKPCVLIPEFERMVPFKVDDDACTGCGNCLNVGCPAILVKKRETVTKNNREQELAFCTIDFAGCTGCSLCVKTCGPGAIKLFQPKSAETATQGGCHG